MGIVRISIVFVLAIFLGWGIYGLVGEHSTLSGEVRALQEKKDAAKEENTSVSEEIDFLKDPQNRVKVLKEQTNVVAPGENLIILVSPHASSSATSSEEKKE